MLKGISDGALSKMNATYKTLKSDLSGLRTGKPNPSILDGVVVNVYNNNIRLNQVATVSISGNKMLSVSVWDVNNANIVNKAIANSNLGLNPILEGSTIKIPLPDLSEERRKELIKVANGYSERAKVAIRNIRRDAIANLKNLNKEKEISEDDLHRALNDMQKITNDMENNIEKMLESKTQEILES
ncbi:MAG: ribosome recycling factor [Rickettsiaceae bacterium H1]|nr:ribosome recycling factor [Rickettsiaceae bacterium H1]